MSDIGYVMLSIATMLLGADFAVNKSYQKICGATLKASLFFNMLVGAVSAVLFVCLGGLKNGFSVYSAIMAAISALLIMSYNIIGFKILQSTGKIAIYTMHLLTGGMLLPYIWGIIFRNEAVDLFGIIGLVLMICGVVTSNFVSSGKKTDKRVFIMCAAVFVINGFVSIVSKIHQTQTAYKCVNEMGFVALSGCSKAICAAAILCFLKKNTVQGFFKPKIAGLAAVSAVFSGVSYMLQLTCAKTLSATILYPFITGGSVIFSAIMDLIIFKEKLSKQQVIGVLLCFAGTIFMV